MKTITCDEAFEALTDPRDRAQPDLDQHLATCARCRELRTVLEPALALFAGDAPVEPACSGGPVASRSGAVARTPAASPPARLLSPAAVLAAGEAARRLSTRGGWRVLPGAVVRTATIFLVGFAAAFGVASIGTDRPHHQPPTAPATVACLWTAGNQPASRAERAEDVILSCVACHLPTSAQ